ncbi:MAG: general secretion pathway protein GspB [Cellvibrionaceae bacterium]
MSYILDALKKSEQEGQETDVPPGLHSIHASQVPTEKTKITIPFAWVVAALLIIVLSLGAGAFFSQESTPETAITTQPNLPAAPAQQIQPAQPQREQQQSKQALESKLATTPPTVSIKTTEILKKDIQRQNIPTKKRTAQQALQSPPAVETDLSDHLSPGDTIIKPSKKLPLKQATTQKIVISEFSNDVIAPLVDELSPSERRQIPDLKYSGHIYSNNPSSSFVIINGSSRYIGDDINGARIESIAPKSVTINYQGIRFRMDFI